MNTLRNIANWSLVQEIGSGCSSIVKLGFDPAENTFAAIKVAKPESRVHKQAIVNETNILRKLNHPNIAKLIDSHIDIDWEDERGEIKQVSAIVTELVPHGELSEFITKTGRLEETIARYHFLQLVEALQYCHQKGVVHRDIKPDNLLLDADFNIKLVDFGFSKSVSNKSNMTVVGCVGTDSYMAPELFFHQPYDGQRADLFSAGVVLFLMVAGHLPFSIADPKDQLYKLFISNSPSAFWEYHEKEIAKSDPNITISAEFKELITGLLAIDPEDRLTVDEIKKHPWMQGALASKEELKREFSQRSAIVQPIISQIVVNKQDLLRSVEPSLERFEQKASPVQVSKQVVSVVKPIVTIAPPVEKEKTIKITSLAQITSPGLPNISLN